MQVTITGPSLLALFEASKTTHCEPLQVVIDALNVYHWIQDELRKGHKIRSHAPDGSVVEITQFFRGRQT